MRRPDFILLYMIEREFRRRVIYGILSLIVPGLGQVVSSRVLKGITQFVFFALFLIVIKTVWNGYNFAFLFFIVSLMSYWLYVAWDAYAHSPSRTAPCEKACPVGIDVSGYMNLAVTGDFDKGKDLIYHRTPFIGTLSYICHEPCKEWCARRKIDTPLEIRAIKRYIFENAKKKEFDFKKRYKEKIAVVGSGPSGLSCAYFLARLGYETHVFDARSKPGGALSEFIPEYRLPSRVLESDIEEILSISLINFHGRTALGRDMLLSDLLNNFNAVYIATGAWGKRRLDIKGEDKKGVFHALDFLKMVKQGRLQKIYGTVYVIGGGDVAADVARSAIRLSVHRKVVLAYRRSKKEMRIDELELSEMEEEGIEVLENVVPVEIKGKDSVESVVLAKTLIEDGRITITDEKTEKEAAFIILAVGQGVHRISKEVETDEAGRIVIKKNHETSVENVFAGGDAVRGPSSLVESLYDGREAARQIHKKLHLFDYFVRDFLIFEPYHEKPGHLLKFKYPIGEHVSPPKVSYNKRVRTFEPVELPYNKLDAEKEASRCLACPFRYK